MRNYMGVLACGALLGGCATGALPGGGGEGRVFAGAPTPPPRGLLAYCAREPGACEAAAGNSATRSEVALTEALWRELRDVNRTVNREVWAQTDQDLYGLADYWARPSDAGDCEDFALEKRARLIELGWPADALALAIALAPSVGVHAALVAQTDRGDFVLDNLHHAPRPVDDMGYLWISRQSGASLSEWAMATRKAPGADFAAPLTAEQVFRRRLGASIAEARAAEPGSLR